MSLLNMFLQKLSKSFSLLCIQLLLILLCSASNFYIVFLGADPVSRDIALETHLNVLSAVKGSYLEAKESLAYSYTKSFNAFAAKLSEDEANMLSAMDEVNLVFENQYRKLHTTRSWNFIGLPLTAKRRLKVERDIVVGLLDTGAKYFKADGRTDPLDILSPIDVDGHGTHTASTATGNLVSNASLFGLANGTARGAVPSARLSVYKVCWSLSGCADMDILAAFDAAIHDGVDVISISIGGGNPDFVHDSISVGAFHAMRKGIITVASAGNDGPSLGSVTNSAPWIVTVAASGIDRSFKSTVHLGSGKNISGIGINCFNPKRNEYPLINGIDAAKDSKSKDDARFCYKEALEPNKVKGKVVYCKLDSWGAEAVVKELGGMGAIIESDQYPDVAQIFMAPATIVNNSIGESIIHYTNSTRSSSICEVISSRLTPAAIRSAIITTGPAPTIFNATIRSPKGVEITVKPTILNFSKTKQRKSFKVVVKVNSIKSMQMLSGSLIWRSPRYIVRSPIVIYRQ
ncbi:Peptidase S8/S53 domain [Sesbania bispinosa]|nr:Peptidase S8/S53 domain [Sesbania bispinosa]